MRSVRHDMFEVAQLAAALAMFPSLAQPSPARRRSRGPYHLEGRDTVLMDWDLPKGKRAKRRARGRRVSSQNQTEAKS